MWYCQQRRSVSQPTHGSQKMTFVPYLHEISGYFLSLRDVPYGYDAGNFMLGNPITNLF